MSVFIICRGLCACNVVDVCAVCEGSNVRPRTFGCVAMGSAVLFISRSRLFLYSAGSGVNRVKVVLSGFSIRLFCFCRYGCMYFLVAVVIVCVVFIIVPGMLVYSSFLISVCMFIVSTSLLISSATMIVRAAEVICLNPFATVLFSVCSAVTVECCVLYPCCVGVFGMLAVMLGRMLFSRVLAITERGDMGLYEVPFSMTLLGLRWGQC